MSQSPVFPSDVSYDDGAPCRSTVAACATPAVAAPGGRFPGAPLRVATSPDIRESLSPAQDAPGGEWLPPQFAAAISRSTTFQWAQSLRSRGACGPKDHVIRMPGRGKITFLLWSKGGGPAQHQTVPPDVGYYPCLRILPQVVLQHLKQLSPHVAHPLQAADSATSGCCPGLDMMSENTVNP